MVYNICETAGKTPDFNPGMKGGYL